MPRLAPRCPHCGRAVVPRGLDDVQLTTVRMAAAHGGETTCARCGREVRLRADMEFVLADE